MLKRLFSSIVAVAIAFSTVGPVMADTSYVVQAGDTLSGIAVKCGVSMQAIISANGISNPNLVSIGQRLTIPGSNSCGSGSTSTGTSGSTTTTTSTGSYTVQAGDTLGGIAFKFGTTVSAILNANKLTNPNLIFVGQTLIIPGTTVTTTTPSTGGTGTTPTTPTTPTTTSTGTYTVVAGDSLGRIASRFGVSVSAIMSANGLSNPNLIFVGQVLKIPGATTTGTTPAPSPTQAPTTGTTPPPVTVPSGPFSGFALGGHIQGYGYKNQMLYAGMQYVKVQVRWTPGANPGDQAGTINDAHNNGFKILLGVVGSPDSIRGGANYDSFASYVAGLARLGADAIEVWNEPNIDREWPSGEISGSRYAQLLAKSYNAIKGANANTIVISGAPAPTGAEGAFGPDHVRNDDGFMAELAAAGGASYMDCIGAHYNEGIISPTQTSGDPRGDYFTRYYQGMVSTYYNAFGGRRPLCFTELGYLTPEGYGPLPGSFGWAANTTLAQQAEWLGQAANLSKNNGLVRIMIIWNVDFTRYDDDPMAGYAIIRPGGACPACDKLRAVTGGR